MKVVPEQQLRVKDQRVRHVRRPRPELLDTPLGMDLVELAERILGPEAVGTDVVVAALKDTVQSRMQAISRTVSECRRRDVQFRPLKPSAPAALAQAVETELARANAALAYDQREVLGLAEMFRLCYRDIAGVMRTEPAYISTLLAQARLDLAGHLHAGAEDTTPECAERHRALDLLARRQDAEPVSEADQAWILAHMTACPSCAGAHAQMLEASLRYRAWSRP